MSVRSGRQGRAAEAGKKASILSSRREARRAREVEHPVEVRLSVSYRFGEDADDRVTMINDRAIPMVGSVFSYRDRIVRNFAMLTLKAGMTQPKVLAELVPAVRWLFGSRGADAKSGEAGNRKK